MDEIEKVKQEMRMSRMIFSEKEIDDTVKSFILAYIHSKIRINFPDEIEIKENVKRSGKKLTLEESFNRNIKMKSDLLRNINICCGVTPSTTTDLEIAQGKIFQAILVYKISDRLEGSFLKFNENEKISEFKNKLDEFENKLDATNNLIIKLLQELLGKFKE